MVRIVRTNETRPNDLLNQWERDQVYNGLDCCVTAEVLPILLSQLDDNTSGTYSFSRSLQGPALEMRLRGVLVDQGRKAEVIDEFHETLDRLETNLERIVLDGVGMIRFNWRSPDDLKMLFYQKLGIPEIKSKGRVTTDRKALEKLDAYLNARVIVQHILAMRDIAKKISVLRTEVDSDGRMRTSYNIAGTSTGRFSSSYSEFGTGGNLQNVEESLRSIYISDKGMKFAKCDAKSGESFVVGAIEWNLFDDPRYLDACESGDPHTAVARICWPSLGWTGDLKHDKALAERPYYRHYTYRFMCKKLGHGSNYDGQPETLAQQSQLPQSVVEAFQPKYFSAFPAHRLWQDHVRSDLRSRGFLITLTGRKRWFLGRRNDPATQREAIAYDPQGSLADIVNKAMLHIWRKDYVIVVMHDHDALTFMYPEEIEDEVIPRIMEDLVVSVPLANGRVLRIPYDCKVGWNKGEYHATKNPNGLKDYHGHDERKREAEATLVDRLLHRKYRTA